MGNCCIHESPVSWADDDEWGWSEDQEAGHRLDEMEKEDSEMGEKQRMLDGKRGIHSTDQVKIKITKKQFQELLREVDGKGFHIKQILVQLMRENETCRDQDDHGHWRPGLQSIPEVLE